MTTQDKKTPEALYKAQWTARFNELCYHIYFNTEAGKEFLQMCEYRYFYAPVCLPGVDRSFADNNEGRNEFIRSLRNGGQTHMQKPKNQDENPRVDRERK